MNSELILGSRNVEGLEDSGTDYINLTVYRSGYVRIATGYFSGSHAADEIIWTLNDIDKPTGTIRAGAIGTNKCACVIFGTNKNIMITQATDSLMQVNIAYLSDVYV